MKKLLLLPVLFFLMCSFQQNPDDKEKIRSEKSTISQEWIQLFNGNNLDGWTIKMCKHPMGENYNNTFRVENGMMVTRYDQYEKFDGEYGH